jgi:phage nucleotide-binding protein
MAEIPGAINASELHTARGMTGVLYGHPGAGKTTTAAGVRKLSYGGKVLFIDCEGGARSLRGLDNVLVRRITEYSQIRPLFEFLDTHMQELDIRTIVIDTISALQRLGLNQLMTTSKTPELANMGDYGRSNEQIGRLVRNIADFAEARVDPRTGEIYGGWNVFFTAHLTEAKDDTTGAMLTRPSLTPKAAEVVCGIVDMVGLVTVEARTGRRMLIMENLNNAIGKIRQPADTPAMPTKLYIPNTKREDGTEDQEVVPVLARVLQHDHGEINLNDTGKYPELFPHLVRSSDLSAAAA